VSATLRRATQDDVAFLAWVALAASRSHVARAVWDLFHDDAEDAVLLAFLEDLLRAPGPHWCRAENFRIASVDGVPAAALSGYDPAWSGYRDVGAVIEETLEKRGWSEAQSAAAFGRIAPFLEATMKDEPGAWIVEWVATRPAFRRRGLVDALLRAELDAAREAGYRRAQLTILIGNHSAEAAYQRVGFRFADERHSAGFESALGSPGLRQLSLDLEA
jgi:translation initiation factor 4G